MATDSGKAFETQVLQLARNGLALATGGIVAQLAFTLLEVLVARKLGAEAYGTFVTAYAWTVLGSFLMEIGTPFWTIQEGSRQHDRLPDLLGSSITVNFFMFTVLYASLVATASWLTTYPVLSYLLILLPYGLILTMQNGLAAVYSSYQTMQINALFQGLAPVAILGIFLVYAAGELTLNDVGYAYVIGGAVVTGIWFVYTIRRVRPTVSLPGVVRTVRSSFSYGLTGILGQVYFKTDIVMLSALAGLREAGIYAAAFKLVEVLYKVAVLSGRVFAPALFKASRETGKNFRTLASMMTRLLAFTGLMAGLVSFVMADTLMLLLFGEDYSASAPVLRILGGVMAVRCMMIAMQLLLSSVDLHMKRVTMIGVAVVVQIIAGLILIPDFGAIGAAAATLISGALLIVLYAAASIRHGEFRYVHWLLVPSALAVAAALMSLLADWPEIVRTMAAAAAFLLGLILTRFVRQDELVFVYRSIKTGFRRN